MMESTINVEKDSLGSNEDAIIMEEGDNTNNSTFEVTALEDEIGKGEDEEEEVLRESRMQEVELKYASLQQCHMDLQAVCDEQQRTIEQLQQQQQQYLTEGDRYDKKEVEATFQRVLEKERSERLNTEEQKKLIQERLDRVLGENDLLREELARLHQSYTELSTQLQQVEVESKMATSSQIPLRFRLERAEQGNRELTAQYQWLENEMTTLREEYEFKLQQKVDMLHAERQRVAKMASEEAERHTHILSLHQEKLHKITTEHQQAILNLQNDHSQQMQSLQQALLAEQNLNRLHQANQEEKQHKVDTLQQSLLTMQSMAQAAEREQQEIQSRLIEEHQATLAQIQEQRAHEVSNLEQEIDSLQSKLNAIEQRNIRRERRRAASAAAAAPLLTADGSTTTVVVEEEAATTTTTNMMVVVPSLTDLIDRLADTEDQLKEEMDERRRVELILAKTQVEIEARTPLLRAQRQQYEQAIHLQQESQRQLEDRTRQYQQYLQLYEESCSNYQLLHNQLKLLQRENQDLARQIQSLLKSRLGQLTEKTDGAVTGDLIVEFESIEELQQQNQCLIRDHRQLTDRIQALEEQLDHNTLTKQLESAIQEVELLREERNQQEIIAKSITQQRDMYRDMCSKNTSSEESAPEINAAASSDEHRLQKEDNSKLQGDLAHVRNENQALQERVKRLDAYAADIVTSLNQVQGELLSAQSLCARSQAEADFYKKQCDRYKESMEVAQSETKHIQNARTELQNIQMDMEKSLTQAREEIAKLEQLDIRKKSQIRLLEGQLEASQHAEQRLLAELESARMELGRQGSLIESVHRIESSLIARNTEQQQQQLEEMERQRKNMTQEIFKQAAELERLQRILEETEEKKSSAEIARDKAVQEELKAKTSVVDSAQKLLDVQSMADNLQEKCDNLERELATTKGRLEAISLSSTDKVKDATIESLSNELESAKSKLTDAKERVLIYQKVAKDNEKSLAEMTSSYEAYKETITEELEQLKRELALANSAAEAKQAALDELSEELANQRGSQLEEIDQLKQKNGTLTRQLENSKEDLETTVQKLSSVEEEIQLHKATAAAARVSCNSALFLFFSLRRLLMPFTILHCLLSSI
jgi:nucleoprotein TPR